ncbi:MAG TPA: SUMF1/EgtB/PvdO family nonheme iron enzyme [Rhodanobacteraceae bacterium]|nr:SUMF1/EgtB/PvdO family nonheme iron enzyme [Rhodanobacteraceae bacterium]
MSAPVAEFEVPGHRLVRPLGRGGMATVYLAIQSSLGRPVAVKILQAATDETITRFEQEARTIARLQHPHIVAIYEVGRTSDGQLYYTMPYLPNGDLSKVDLRDSPSRIAAVIRALAGALGHAHKQGIVHRDVKPENVLFDQHRRALLTDFGIARASDSLRVTREGATMGSSGYMSPEQARGQDIDGRSDLYSLGVVCYELLTGDLPFRGADALSTAIAHIEQPVPRLPPLKRAWQPFVDKALAKSPEARFQNAEEMIAALDAVDGRHTSPRPVVPAAPPRSKFQWPEFKLPRIRLPALSGFRPPRIKLPSPRIVRRYGPALLMLLALIAVSAAALSWRSHARRTAAVPSAQATLASAAHASSPVSQQVAATQPVASPAPATSADASQPAIAVPVEPSSVDSAQAAHVSALLAQADALFSRDRLTVPKEDSAVARYREVLQLEPDNRNARTGIGRIMAVLQRDVLNAWRRGDTGHVQPLVTKLDGLVPFSDPVSQKSWHDARVQLAHSVGDAMAGAARSKDGAKVAALRPLAGSLPAIYPEGFDPQSLDQTPVPPSALHAGSMLHDDGGPTLVYVPADGKADAFAIGRTEVTRSEYAQFARETHRPAASCVEAFHPFSRWRGLKWNDPGFPQTGDHPAVCVSWSDAAAYAAWLSRRTGEPYRLPTESEWLRTARGVPAGSPCARGNVDDATRQTKLDNDRFACSDGAAETAPVGRYAPSGVGAYDMYGNVSEWLDGGSAGERVFRGLSWRDGSHQTVLGRKGTAGSDIGYTSIGFRVVRVIDARHPAPNG